MTDVAIPDFLTRATGKFPKHKTWEELLFRQLSLSHSPKCSSSSFIAAAEFRPESWATERPGRRHWTAGSWWASTRTRRCTRPRPPRRGRPARSSSAARCRWRCTGPRTWCTAWRSRTGCAFRSTCLRVGLFFGQVVKGSREWKFWSDSKRIEKRI